ncbi:hypothetical protein GpartN1_g1572.t1 [Galdieria partita]|uniref:RRM domain-containing protein n=1 Tax=Galdieria partita TaxID=83374 RepID=A0A9C7PTW7_9RHOD|nr:hypothetical protein GpartN1_g1572.t1 [Galdieria partita]
METLEAFAESELEKLGFEGDLSALAKYVSALLSGTETPVEEQVDKYVQDLEEFLGSNSAPFVAKVVDKYKEIFRKPEDSTKQVEDDQKVDKPQKRLESRNPARFERRAAGRIGNRTGTGSTYSSQRENSAKDSFRVKERKTSLHIRCVPEEKLNEQAVRDYFKRFGTVTEVLLLPHKAPCRAIVTFSSEKEASEAILCRDAVMGDRFIKLYWAHKEDFEDKPEGWFERTRGNGDFQHQWKNSGHFDHRPRPFNYRKPFSSSYWGTSLHWSSDTVEEPQTVAAKRERESDQLSTTVGLPEKRSKVEQERILNKYLENKRYILQRFESLKDSLKPEQKKAILEELKSLDNNIESCLANITKVNTQESNILGMSTTDKSNNE